MQVSQRVSAIQIKCVHFLCGSGRTTKSGASTCSFANRRYLLSCIPVGMIRMGLIKSIQSAVVVDKRGYNAWYGWTRNVISPPRKI
jgi:hypothetical protein